VITGNADGIGETRKKELVESAKILGIRSAEDVLVLDDPCVPYVSTILGSLN